MKNNDKISENEDKIDEKNSEITVENEVNNIDLPQEDKEKIEIREDFHYQCHKCNKNYIM